MADDLKTFSIQEARQIALVAQGFGEARPDAGTVSIADLDRVLRTLNIVQIDTINVLVRAQYMPFFSRLGPYSQGMLHRYAFEDRNLFEYYAHAASLTPMEHVPLLRHRMQEWQPWKRWNEIMGKHSGLLDSMLAEIREEGPMEVADFEFKGERFGRWATSVTKLALETLMFQGVLAVSDRLNSARRYDLIERVVPEEVLEMEAVPREEAHRETMKLAVGSLGIGTESDLADYYRIKRREAARALKDLVDRGEVERVRVEGVDGEMFASPGIEAPDGRFDACAIVSPFDSVAWFRDRLEWLWDFDYRIEIYVPVKKRKYGYYVMPFLMGDRFVARVDLKADRPKSVLRVPSAFLEEGVDEAKVASKLASELRLMADWLGLDRIVIGRRGGLTRALRAAVKSL